jgi:DNA-binding transcriptional LysR family regulator
MVDPADMLLFAAVMREQSFTAAAKSLGITKQSVSERISKLEHQLGVRLLERTTRSLRATDAGASYYEKAALIAAQIEEANREVQHAQLEPTGLLRVSAPVLYGRRLLPPIVAAFIDEHPKVRIELILTDRRVNLIEEGVDVAIRVGPLDDSTLAARRLALGYVYCVASPTYLTKYGRPKNAEELQKARCIAIRPGEVWEVNRELCKIEPVVIINDLEAACDAARRHVGIARLPSLVCGEPVRSGALVNIFGQCEALTREVHAVFPSKRYLPPKVRLFVEALATGVAPMEPLPDEAR